MPSRRHRGDADGSDRTGPPGCAKPDAVATTSGSGLTRLLAGARTRILLAFVVLLAFSTALSVFAIRQVLLVRTGDRVDAALSQEVEEFRTLVRGSDPDTGEPFAGDLAAISPDLSAPQRPGRRGDGGGDPRRRGV